MTEQRPLLIDAQLLQTTAWDRGMGHYCRSLLAAYEKESGSHHITLVLNNHLPFDDHRRKLLTELLPNAKVVELSLPTLTGEIAKSKLQAITQLDKFISNTFGDTKVDFLILQLFTFDYCASFPTNANKLLVCYDLIPLLYWKDFSHIFAAHMYFPHFATIFAADKLLAISETTKRQLQDCFSLDGDHIVNLNGSSIERKVAKSLGHIDIPEPFLLMPSADFPHKNNLAAVKAFAKFNRELADQFTLVITSNISEKTRKLLTCYTDRLIFTGNITDEELEYLYRKTYALLFISSVEGLGLPILEAVYHDKPVISSSIDVFKEISDKAFYFCDPQDVASIATAIRQAVIGSDWSEKQACYEDIRAAYTWEKSAQHLADALQGNNSEQNKHDQTYINIVLPHPASTESELGGYVQSLIPALGQNAKVCSYISIDSPSVDNNQKPFYLPYIAAMKSIHSLMTRQSPTATTTVYFIDDTAASVDVFRAALMRPGVCYVTTKRAGGLLKAMASRGFITNTLEKAQATALPANSLIEILQRSGSQVYLLDTQKRTVSFVDREGKNSRTTNQTDQYELAQTIIENSKRKGEGA